MKTIDLELQEWMNEKSTNMSTEEVMVIRTHNRDKTKEERLLEFKEWVKMNNRLPGPKYSNPIVQKLYKTLCKLWDIVKDRIEGA